MHLLLLVACAGPHDTAFDDSARDTVDTADSADTDAPDDTDTADDTAEDTDPPPADPDGPHTWNGHFFGGADLTIRACGTEDGGDYRFAPGPDLDGDGLPEVAVGAPDAEATALGQGVVYLLRGADLAGGTASVFDAWARVPGPRRRASEGFGERLQWVGDRDGDGVDDLLVGSDVGRDLDDVARVVSGSALAVGGEVGVAGDEIEEEGGVYARWDDLDGDGADDWIVGWPNRGMGGAYGYRGTLAPVYDGDFDLDGVPTAAREVYGQDAEAHAGRTLAVLDGDYDGDGVREVATNLGADIVVVSSGALLDWATYVDEVVLWRFLGMDRGGDGTLLALGDVDRGGRDDLLFHYPRLSICLGRGEDADATGVSPTCLRDPELDVPNSVTRGADLDGDGVADLWGRTEDALVAWDMAALLEGRVVERARIAVADGQTAHVVATDGALWTSARVGGRVEAAAAWRFPEVDGLTAADASVTVTGGGWGGSPEEPAWLDLTGDGLDDLVFFDAGTLDVFDGAGLPAGGELGICDADLHVEVPDAATVAWLPDLDGDGAVDALLAADGHASPIDRYRVVSGRVLAGLATGPDLASWESDYIVHIDGCDLTGDGRDEVFVSVDDREDTLRAYDGGALLTGAGAGDLDAALLGAVVRDNPFAWCVPDVDGDGGDELVVESGGDHRLFLAAQLDPATTLDAAAAWFTFTTPAGDPGWYMPVHVGDLDGDGADEHAWYLRVTGAELNYDLCLLDPAPLALGGTLAHTDAPLDCLGAYANVGPITVDHAIGGPEADLVLLGADEGWNWSFHAYDGATLTTSTVIEPVFDYGEYDDYMGWTGGFGPDVLDTGARSLWTRWAHGDVALWNVEVVYARTP